MQGSKDRILTTHVGSLPRTLPVLDAMKVRFDGATFDDETYQLEAPETNTNKVILYIIALLVIVFLFIIDFDLSIFSKK